MARILDTNVLCSWWHKKVRHASGDRTVRQLGQELLDVYNAKGILTPIWIEFVAGATSAGELRRYLVFLSAFPIVDDGDCKKEDWEQAKRVVARIGREGRPRQLGDCLIRAIANRLRCEVVSFDAGFPR